MLAAALLSTLLYAYADPKPVVIAEFELTDTDQRPSKNGDKNQLTETDKPTEKDQLTCKDKLTGKDLIGPVREALLNAFPAAEKKRTTPQPLKAVLDTLQKRYFYYRLVLKLCSLYLTRH